MGCRHCCFHFSGQHQEQACKEGSVTGKKVNDAFWELQAAMGLAGSPGSKEIDQVR